MINHFEGIKELYGENAYVQIPNEIFRDLSSSIKNKGGSTNIQQSSFAYAYLVCLAFLYKYAYFVDINNDTYLQNKDIKIVLGYSPNTKSIDYIIKRNGLLECIGLTKTTNDYPVFASYIDDEYNGLKIREITTISMIDESHSFFSKIKSIVKNRNYKISEPRFLFEYKDDAGTLYDYSNTHRITIKEFIEIIYNSELDNIDFMLYAFFKSKCFNLNNNMKSIPLLSIVSEIGISKDAFYSHLNIMKDRKLLNVNHKEWVMGDEGSGESNDYQFLGV